MFVRKLVAYPNIDIDSIDWKLTDATGEAVGSKPRKEVFRDAAQKGNDYAEVVDRKVVAVEIVDTGQPSPGMSRSLFRQ